MEFQMPFVNCPTFSCICAVNRVIWLYLHDVCLFSKFIAEEIEKKPLGFHLFNECFSENHQITDFPRSGVRQSEELILEQLYLRCIPWNLEWSIRWEERSLTVFPPFFCGTVTQIPHFTSNSSSFKQNANKDITFHDKLKSSGCLQRWSPALGFCEMGYYLISDTGFTKANFTGNAFLCCRFNDCLEAPVLG